MIFFWYCALDESVYFMYECSRAIIFVDSILLEFVELCV